MKDDLNTLTWMDPQTQQNALLKLSLIANEIGGMKFRQKHKNTNKHE